MLESLRDEVKEMNTNFMKLETDVCIIKTVNNLLMKTSVEIQRQCWGNSQYSRRECWEIAGTPKSITQQNFEEKFWQLSEATGISDDKNDIDDSHRLTEKEQKIVNLLQCKDCKRVFQCKKDLQCQHEYS